MFMGPVYPTAGPPNCAPGGDSCHTAEEMKKPPPCPHLVRETTVHRASLDVSVPAQYEVISTWYCTHPFHGIRLELGDGRADVEQHCGVCTLPRAQEEPDDADLGRDPARTPQASRTGG
jgi:hypothetical protein